MRLVQVTHPWGATNGVVPPAVSMVARPGVGFKAALSGSGELPAVDAEVQAEGEESAQVDRGRAVVKPQIVAGHSSVAQPPRTSHAIVRSTMGRCCRKMAWKLSSLARSCTTSAAGSRHMPVRTSPCASGEFATQPGRAGQRARGRVVGEVIDGEPARHGRLNLPLS